MQVKRKRRRTIGDGEPITIEKKRSLWDRDFWALVCGIILVSVFTRTFDYSLVPMSYKGLFITRPYYGLHSDTTAAAAWAARSHVKYGFGYTKGYRTLVVGDPPPARPQRDVGQPPLGTWITALGMRLFGTQEGSIRLFDMILSVPALALMMFLLRKLYGSGCALLAGLLLAVFPLSGYLGFEPPLILLSLWALWRYLLLIRELGEESRSKVRHGLELAAALFVLIQLSWAGVFYALTMGLHYVVHVVICRRIRWAVLAILMISPLLSVTLNIGVMVAGYRSNIAAEAKTKRPAQFTVDRGGILPPLVQKLGPEREDTAWGRMKAQFQAWVTGGERGLFPSRAQLARIVEHAGSNFSPAVLVFCGVYVVYLAAAPVVLLVRRVLASGGVKGQSGSAAIPRPFTHVWFFLFPGLLFLLVFRGLALEHPHWQAPLALFVAVGAALGILLVGDVFAAIHRLFGGSVVAALTVLSVVFCNQVLAEHRAVRTISPRTLGLFQKLGAEIPPGQLLLKFKDFTVPSSGANASIYRPEYAWYLDREMVVANAWHYNPNWAGPAQIDKVVDDTIGEIQRQAKTGRFAYYFIPAREHPDYDPLYYQSREEQLQTSVQRMGLTWAPDEEIVGGEARETPPSLATLDPNELERRLNDRNWAEDTFLYWEKHRRYREAVIVRLKELYRHEYYDNASIPGDDDFDREGDTPCYLFDLSRPRQ